MSEPKGLGISLGAVPPHPKSRDPIESDGNRHDVYFIPSTQPPQNATTSPTLTEFGESSPFSSPSPSATGGYPSPSGPIFGHSRANRAPSAPYIAPVPCGVKSRSYDGRMVGTYRSPPQVRLVPHRPAITLSHHDPSGLNTAPLSLRSPSVPGMRGGVGEGLSAREKRRRSHINSEKKRRESIKSGLVALSQIVPACQHPNDSKASILSKTREYILALESAISDLEGQKQGAMGEKIREVA
jgi:hypothetical protein